MDGQSRQESLRRFLQEVFPSLGGWVPFSFWVDLAFSCSNCESVVNAVAEAARNEPHRTWLVQESTEIKAVSTMLRYHQPSRLDIVPLPNHEQTSELLPLLEAVASCHKGLLDLSLKQSYKNFSDNESSALVICLEDAKCKIVSFMGCLSGSNERASRALVDGVKRAQTTALTPRLFISLLDARQHQLGQLQGLKHELDIRVRLPSTPGICNPLPSNFVINRRPPKEKLDCTLKNGRPPKLTLDCTLSQADAHKDEMIALILDLAPKNKWYYVLYLKQYPGTAEALNNIAQQLSEKKVKTDDYDGDPSCVKVGVDGEDNCSECGERRHVADPACFWLALG